MPSLNESVTARIALLERKAHENSEAWRVGNIYIGITNLAVALYGKDSPVLDAIRSIWQQNQSTPQRLDSGGDYHLFDLHLLEHLRGILHTMKNDVASGLV